MKPRLIEIAIIMQQAINPVIIDIAIQIFNLILSGNSTSWNLLVWNQEGFNNADKIIGKNKIKNILLKCENRSSIIITKIKSDKVAIKANFFMNGRIKLNFTENRNKAIKFGTKKQANKMLGAIIKKTILAKLLIPPLI